MEKTQSYKIDKQGRQVLNFQITMTLTLFAALFLLMLMPLALSFMGEAWVSVLENDPAFILLAMCLPMPLVGIFCTYQDVVNAAQALSDKPIHYPLSILFIK